MRWTLAMPLLMISLLAGCSKTTTDDGTGPAWWKSMPLQRREFAAELYRVGIACAVWQDKVQKMIATGDRSDSSWKQVKKAQTIASDRAQLALRLADAAQQKALKWMLQIFIDQPRSPRDSLREWQGFIRLEVNPDTTITYDLSNPNKLGTVEFVVNERLILLDRNSGLMPVALPEPREERSPMGKLLRSSWEMPKDSGEVQRSRWRKMVETEFDDPAWQLGGVSRIVHR